MVEVLEPGVGLSDERRRHHGQREPEQRSAGERAIHELFSVGVVRFVRGRSRDEVEAARDQLKAMLKSGGPVPDAPFDGLHVLEPARDFKNRHASILLAFEATLDAIDSASESACA